MRAWFLAFGLTIASVGGIAAQTPEDGQAIQGVIERQIEAFRLDDFDTAFTFAGPGIQGLFQNPETFGEMVRGGYPMVWRPQDLRFGELRAEQGILWQRIIVRDANGATHVLDYRMGQYDGAWRIDGVQLVRAPGVAA